MQKTSGFPRAPLYEAAARKNRVFLEKFRWETLSKHSSSRGVCVHVTYAGVCMSLTQGCVSGGSLKGCLSKLASGFGGV